MKQLVLGIAVTAVLTSWACFAQSAQSSTAASGNDNQAVATTSANAGAPAKGANSFTAVQARTRIEKAGFANVTDLRKDNDGVWHGQAQKDGSNTTVWLDYKGNVGQAQ